MLPRGHAVRLAFVDGARIGVGSLSVEPFYEATNNGTDWYGRLHAYSLKVDESTRGIVSEEAWEASAKMPAAASRRIRFWRNGELVDFTGSNVSFGQPVRQVQCDVSGHADLQCLGTRRARH